MNFCFELFTEFTLFTRLLGRFYDQKLILVSLLGLCDQIYLLINKRPGGHWYAFILSRSFILRILFRSQNFIISFVLMDFLLN